MCGGLGTDPSGGSKLELNYSSIINRSWKPSQLHRFQGTWPPSLSLSHLIYNMGQQCLLQEGRED